MTENEAIKILDTQKQCLDKSSSGQCKIRCADCRMNIPITYQEKAIKIAISVLKEIQQYREIGTVEECREAMEKQKSKKIIIKNWSPTCCPTCGHELSTSLGDGYYKHPTFLKMCPACGQAIQWHDNLEADNHE